MTILAETKHLVRTFILVDESDPVTVSAGSIWKSTTDATRDSMDFIWDVSQSQRGAWSLDFGTTLGGSSAVTMTVRGGNFRPGTGVTRTDLPDLGVASADLPTFTAGTTQTHPFGVENHNYNFGQVWLAVATEAITIDYAVLRVW